MEFIPPFTLSLWFIPSGHLLSENCHKPEGINDNNIVGYLDCYEVKTDRGKHYQEEDEIDRSNEKSLSYSPLIKESIDTPRIHSGLFLYIIRINSRVLIK